MSFNLEKNNEDQQFFKVHISDAKWKELERNKIIIDRGYPSSWVVVDNDTNFYVIPKKYHSSIQTGHVSFDGKHFWENGMKISKAKILDRRLFIARKSNGEKV